MRRLALLLGLSGIVAADPASAALWRLAATGGAAPERSIFYVDIDSIRRSGDDLTVVTLSFFETTTANRDFDKSIITRRANCAAMTSQITRSEFYLKGKLLQVDTAGGNLVNHSAGSVMYGTLMAICGKRAYIGEPVTTPQPYWPPVTAAPTPAPSSSPVPYRYGGH